MEKNTKYPYFRISDKSFIDYSILTIYKRTRYLGHTTVIWLKHQIWKRKFVRLPLKQLYYLILISTMCSCFV